ncbi:hypothetical protein BDQ17DRAFT_1428905 [Cyathus striatus]|nr:hypothetical protein BDQ17DRAFT_1428905 [Cyathus striatus]
MNKPLPQSFSSPIHPSTGPSSIHHASKGPISSLLGPPPAHCAVEQATTTAGLSNRDRFRQGLTLIERKQHVQADVVMWPKQNASSASVLRTPKHTTSNYGQWRVPEGHSDSDEEREQRTAVSPTEGGRNLFAEIETRPTITRRRIIDTTRPSISRPVVSRPRITASTYSRSNEPTLTQTNPATEPEQIISPAAAELFKQILRSPRRKPESISSGTEHYETADEPEKTPEEPMATTIMEGVQTQTDTYAPRNQAEIEYMLAAREAAKEKQRSDPDPSEQPSGSGGGGFSGPPPSGGFGGGGGNPGGNPGGNSFRNNNDRNEKDNS